MIIYVLIPILLLCLHLLEMGLSPKKRLPLYFGVAVFSFLFVGLRTCGYDYESYYRIFLEYRNIKWQVFSYYLEIEPGYAALNKIVPNYNLLIFVMSFVVIYIQFKYIRKESSYPFLSMFIFSGVLLYSMLMGQYRQIFAISFALLYMNNPKKIFPNNIYLLIAILFHYTAFIVLIARYVPRKKIKTRYYIILLSIAIFFSTLFTQIASVIPIEYIQLRLGFYTDREEFSFSFASTALLLRALIVILVMLFCKSKNNLYYDKFEYYFNLYFLSLLLYIIFLEIPQLAARGATYFAYFEIILCANLLYMVRGWKKWVMYLLILAVTFLRHNNLWNNDLWQETFLPYTNILFDI